MLTFQCLHRMSHSNNLQNKGRYANGTPYTVSHFYKWKINLCILLKSISNCTSPHTMLNTKLHITTHDVISMNERSIYASFWNQYQTAHHHTRRRHFNGSMKCQTLITCRIRDGMLKVHLTPLVISINGRSIYASFWNQYQTAHHHTRCWHFNASAECQTLIRCRIRMIC